MSVLQIDLQPATGLDVNRRTGAGGGEALLVVQPEDGVEGRTLVVDDIVVQREPGDAVLIGVHLMWLAKRLEGLGEIKGRILVVSATLLALSRLVSFRILCALRLL